MFMRHRDPDPELESLIHKDLPFLYIDHGAQVISSEKLAGVGNGQIHIRVLDMVIRVIQKEGSITVLAAPIHKSNSWQAIELLLIAADPNSKFPPRPVYGSLPELSALLQPRLSLLNDALFPGHFESTIQNSRQAGRKGLITITPPPPTQMSVGKRLLIGAIGGLGRAIRFVIPRSKDSYVKTMPVGTDAELEENVRREFGFLFNNHGAKVSSNTRLRIMDFACVSVDVDNLRLRAARDRGSVEISIAPIHAVRYWQSMGEAILALEKDCELPKSIPSSILRGAGPRLEVEFPKLNEAFSETQFPATRQRIREIRENLEKAWIEDRNRKPNGFRASRS
jgi:hypothetical protein